MSWTFSTRGAASQRYQDEEIARTREEGCPSCPCGRVAVRGVRAASGGGDTRALRTRVLPRVLVCRQVALSFNTQYSNNNPSSDLES